ncbi:MAG: hypothetical protein JST39_24035, partial [Bacteroidetes bacterium]|nr:hypothetical protein [Bacteroidota bacterium]
MAKQTGPIQLEGLLGGLSFYKDPDFGLLVKQKSTLTRDKVMNNPNFENPLRNATEFARVVAAGRLLRLALQPMTRQVADRVINGRMNARLLEVLRSDSTHEWGKRFVQSGDPALLEGFNFNKAMELEKVFPVQLAGRIDAATGNMSVDIPAFIPSQVLSPAAGATHFRIVSSGISLDPEQDKYICDRQQTELLAIDEHLFPESSFFHRMPIGAGQTLLLTIGIVFYALPEAIPV